MTVLSEFGIFEENIKNELSENLPFLASTQILMSCVKAGMGREIAHEMIKKHATTTTPSNFFAALAGEKDFPLTIDQLNQLIKNPADFAGIVIEQTKEISIQIKKLVTNQIINVELNDLL
jgi:adenylosuccinate lyase